jgi:UDP-N-acetylmuramoyl-L-alanyl-D-glutamate--2,6-diaminopimelate ligase
MVLLHTPAQAAQWLRQRVTGTLRSDSRQLAPGDGFIAWPGAAVDARQFVAGVLQRGAAACLVESDGLAPFGLTDERVGSYAGLKSDTGAIAAEFFAHPSRQLAVVAVTGTNGKTSTAWWLAQALSALPAAQALPCGVIGTLGVGRPPAADQDAKDAAVISTGLTTPDPVLLQRTLRQFVDDGLRACAMEASSIGVAERRLDGTQIRVAVFTNLTQDHLDYHGTMEAYWQAKCQLFAWAGLASAVINLDDVRGLELAQSLAGTALDVWTVSCQRPARLQARNIAYDAQGLRFDVVEGEHTQVLHTRMIGTYNVSNLLGVLAAMRSLGVPLAAAVQACAALHPVPGRMECLGEAGEPLVAVDYAHTPDALGHALAALRPLAAQRGGRLWCVFGCGGDRDASKRPLMGAIAAQNADQVVVTSDNPRSEKPEIILAQILLGLPQDHAVEVQVDRALAIADAVARAQAQDVILLAGKGHEDTQEIAGVKYPFSDRSHAEQALRQRRQRGPEVQP